MWQRNVFYIIGFISGAAMATALSAPDPLLKWGVAIVCTMMNIALILLPVSLKKVPDA